MFNQKNKGFTLIELLVVVAIIAILSVVVIGAINSSREKGKDSSAMSQMNQARNQAEIYNTQKGNYIGLCTAGTGGIYEYILEATRAIGFEDPTAFITVTQKDINLQYGGVYPEMASFSGPISRCAVSTNPLIPRWAAHVPLLRRKDKVQQYFCIDSTGVGVVTTKDFATADGDTDKYYLGCVE